MRLEDREGLYEDISSDIDDISTVYFKLTEKEPIRKYEILNVMERARVAYEYILEHIEDTKNFSQQAEEFNLGLVGRSDTYTEEDLDIPLGEAVDSLGLGIADDLSESDTVSVDTRELNTGYAVETGKRVGLSEEDLNKYEDYTPNSSLENSEEDVTDHLIYTELPKLEYSLGKRRRPPKPDKERVEKVKKEDMEFEEGEKVNVTGRLKQLFEKIKR